MASDDLELLAFRAVEMTVLGREDARLLIATKRKLSGPRKIARLIAGLANAAGSRRAVLLVGLRAQQVTGLQRRPDPDWWEDLEAGFPGTRPTWDWTIVDIDGAEILAIVPRPTDELIPARRADKVEVPWFDRGGLRRTAPPRLSTATDDGPLPTATVLHGWVERDVVDAGELIETYGGELELELTGVTGLLTDTMCSVTLVAADRDGPFRMAAEIHPSDLQPGVARRDNGIEVRSSFRCRILVAGAVSGSDGPAPPSIQLAMSLMLPGRAVPELRTLALNPTADAPGRFVS